MKVFHHVTRIGFLSLAIALAIGSMGCGGNESDVRSGNGTGIVKGVDASARKITLHHGDIPGLMKGMTMTFSVAPSVGLENVSEGDRVDFRIEQEGSVYTVTEVRRAGS